MQTRAQRRFIIFKSLCEDFALQRGRDWMDFDAMQMVLKCQTFKEVWELVVLPYNETYFREIIQSLEATAKHLASK